MNPRRPLVILFAICGLLMQAFAAAWAAPMLPAAAPAAAEHAAMHDAPCHAEKAGTEDSKPAMKHCCGDKCSCPELCAGAGAALTAMPPALAEQVEEHFLMLLSEPEALPAYAGDRLRPPIDSRS